MKKNLLSVGLILAAGLMLSSCGKKDWRCDCSYTVDAFFFVVTETESETYEKVKEEDAQSDCDAFGASVRATEPTATCTLTELD
jgi:hypothetical protein